tara:strand:- start:179 stop:469 length:291 start_codon:yes stop_codon:yes gene_type:complete
MKNKFKDFLLYTLACIGAVSILLSVQQMTNKANGSKGQHSHSITEKPSSAVPESHVWEAYGTEGSWGWLINKQTGEVFGLNANRKAKIIVQTLQKK